MYPGPAADARRQQQARFFLRFELLFLSCVMGLVSSQVRITGAQLRS